MSLKIGGSSSVGGSTSETIEVDEVEMEVNGGGNDEDGDDEDGDDYVDESDIYDNYDDCVDDMEANDTYSDVEMSWDTNSPGSPLSLISGPQRSYKVIKGSMIYARARSDADCYADIYCISKDAAEAMFRCKEIAFNKAKLEDRLAQHADCSTFLNSIGLQNIHCEEYNSRLSSLQTSQSILLHLEQNKVCQNCFCEYDERNPPFALQCNHFYCTDCFKAYFQTSITEEMSYNLKCLHAHCGAIASEKAIRKVFTSSPESLSLYEKRVRDAYCLNNSNVLKQCPRPECDLVCLITDLIDVSVITCDCGFEFCAKCDSNLDHTPCSCSQFRDWKNRLGNNNSEAWVRHQIRPCPNRLCQAVIEQTGGCLHMKCQVCKHEFCWSCSGDWSKHGTETGGFFACNIPIEKTLAADRDKATFEMKMASRFQKYSDQYVSFHNSEKEALDMLRAKPQDGYINEALLVIASGSHVLMYSYVASYNMSDDPKYRQLFEYQQSTVKGLVDTLSYLVKSDALNRKDIEHFTSVARQHLTRMKASFSEINERNYKAMQDKTLEEQMIEFKDSIEVGKDETWWQCSACTFVNENMKKKSCEVCFSPRPPKASKK